MSLHISLKFAIFYINFGFNIASSFSKKQQNTREREREREKMQLSYCVKEQKPCVRWVEKYFKDCLCNVKDDFSFGFGLISLVCWGVAEIPQIITNFQTKSGHGVSLAFLLTWVVGFVLSSPPILQNTHAHTHKQEHKKEFLTFFSSSSFYLLFTKRKS